MDPASSNFGMMPKVSSITDQISQTESELVVHRDREGRGVVLHIPLDGTQKDNEVLGTPMKTQAHWDGTVLTVDFSGERSGKPVSYKERWSLAPDRKSLHLNRHLTSPRGETDQTLVMIKQ